MNIWVVFSKDRGNKFWSSEQQDWVEFERATRFSEEQKNSGYIPEINIPLGGDDEWMTLDEAFLNHSFQAVKMQHEIAISIDCMLQEDATGETVVFVREGVQLVSKKVAADSIDLDQIQQYEMILFDGGNIHGDQWKHFYFPKQLKQFFLNETPPRPVEHQPVMEISIDGGVSYMPAPQGVRISYQPILVGEKEQGELRINATPELLTSNLWVYGNEGECDCLIGSEAREIKTLTDLLAVSETK